MARQSCMVQAMVSPTPHHTRFESTVLIHLDAAYNLARWITRDDSGAEDAVQDACLRAFRFFDRMQGPSPRAWFMAVVRNACFDWLKEHRRSARDEQFDDEVHGANAEAAETAAARSSDARWLRDCIADLPVQYREVIVLRELEQLSYKEISAVVDVPIGTVMSRLSRGRDLLQQTLAAAGVRRQS